MARFFHGTGPGRFRLLQYFTVTSLVAFALVGAALYYLERAEQTFFQETQRRQNAFFAQAQSDLVRAQKEAARSSLLAQHEAGHVTLARVLSNALWDAHLAALVARASQLPVEPCRKAQAKDKAPCFADLGRRIRALPGFAAAEAAVNQHMRGSAVFKVKVYDPRGLTVYSSELAQIGEDKMDNAGWRSAAGGKTASELVHRDKFSAFEGEVYNRDLIQSYIPARGPDDRILGVFEIYSDVTSLLGQIEADSMRIHQIALANQSRVMAVTEAQEKEVQRASAQHFLILAAVLTGLYAALLLVVQFGQRTIDEQARARERAALREEQAHREMMAALATMAANASHEIGNPLAVIAGLAEDLPRAQEAGEPLEEASRTILEQASRIAEMTRRLTEFSAVRSDAAEPIDANAMVRSVVDFLSFDDRYRATRIDMRLEPQLPACVVSPAQLNEVLMSLLLAHAEASLRQAPNGARMTVATASSGAEVRIEIRCDGGSAVTPCGLAGSDPRLESASRRVVGMGGRLATAGDTTVIHLPCYHAPAESSA